MTIREQELTPVLARSVRRWKLGHHVFHLQLIVMNSTLVELQEAVDSEDWHITSILLRRLTDLYEAATASMKYSADFSADAYAQLIRPSMAPPLLSPGFSGTLNRDHTQMLERLGALRRTIRDMKAHGKLPEKAASDAKKLWKAQARNRRHHMLVCERFVPGGKSQLQEFLADREST